MKALLVLAFVLSAVLHLLLLPVEWISMLFLEPETVDASVRAFRYAAASTVPFLLVSICRFCGVKMFENAFFAGLASRDADFAKAIRKVRHKYTTSMYLWCTLLKPLRVYTTAKSYLLGLGIRPSFDALWTAPAWLWSCGSRGETRSGRVHSYCAVWLPVRCYDCCRYYMHRRCADRLLLQAFDTWSWCFFCQSL